MPVVPALSPILSAATGTVGQMVEETQRHLQGMRQNELNRVNGALTDSATTVACDFDLNSLVPDSFIAIDDEVLYVWTTNEGGRTAEVQRGMLGSTASAHADGALIETNPRFARFAIRRALRQELLALSPPLFAVQTEEVSFASGDRAENLPNAETATPLFLIDIRAEPVSPATTWKIVKAEIVGGMFTGDFLSGWALQLQDDYGAVTTRVRWARPFALDVFDDATAFSTIGLSDSMGDIPPLGAAARLLSAREAVRTDTRAQGESRLAEEVPPGHHVSAARALHQLRDRRVEEELRRLRSVYPMRGF
jgi:hypothetical protein